jgi:hypothetical protein
MRRRGCREEDQARGGATRYRRRKGDRLGGGAKMAARKGTDEEGVKVARG